MKYKEDFNMKLSKHSDTSFTIFQPKDDLKGNTKIYVMPEMIGGDQKVLISIYEEWDNGKCIEEVVLDQDVVKDLITVLSLVDFD